LQHSNPIFRNYPVLPLHAGCSLSNQTAWVMRQVPPLPSNSHRTSDSPYLLTTCTHSFIADLFHAIGLWVQSKSLHENEDRRAYSLNGGTEGFLCVSEIRLPNFGQEWTE
jgi:hypothetical protein